MLQVHPQVVGWGAPVEVARAIARLHPKRRLTTARWDATRQRALGVSSVWICASNKRLKTKASTITVFQPAFRRDEAFRIRPHVMCKDYLELTALLARHNVKLGLSGHVHMLDRIDCRGVTYICDGAVSGGRWRGPHRGFEQGFGIIDASPDGILTHSYHDYAWRV